MATVTGGSGNDSLAGTSWWDTLYGGAGNDTLLAYGGDDSIFGGSGTDVLYAGDGQDVGFGGAGNDIAYGEMGNDTLLGGGGADVFYGDSGMDVLLGEAGNDTLDGGSENDLVEGGVGSDKLLGGAGNDTLSGDASTINPSYFASTGAVDTTLTIVNTASFAIDVYWINTSGVGVYSGTIAPGGSLTKSTGSTHNWYITEIGQTAVLDLIQGAPNQTYTLTPDFNDTLDGGLGDDQINGGLGADSVLAGDGNDTVTGGVGNDTVFGGQGSDNITLGDGNDSFGDWSTEGGNDTVYGGLGNDYIIAGGENDLVDGGDGDDSLSGGIGSDSAYGGAGSDVFLVTDDHEYDYIDGGETGSDFDIVYFGNYLTTQGVTVTFSGTGAGSYDFDGSFGYGSFVGIEALGGTDYADILNAGAEAGGIRLEGNAGNDRITGGSGNDTLYGGVGADTINFGAGADTVYGGDGDDWIDDVNGGSQVGATLIYAGAGNDHIWTGGGNDTVYGEDGNDVIDAEIGNDSLFGGAGSDTISGGDGNDTLSGGAGNDTLSGDADSDLIAITANEGVDLVYGGETGSDRDTLQLNASANEANTVTFTGNEAGTYAYAGGGSGSFSQIEVIETAGGNDRVDASAAFTAVEVYGGTGQDTLIGGSGADTLVGGTGGDVILGGRGNDLIISGAGADQIGLIRGGGGDIVQDFDMTLVAGITADQLDVSDLRTLDGKPLHARDVVISDDGFGNAVLTFPQGEQVTLIGVAPSAVTGKQALAAIGVPCFVRGTRILTPKGERRVEDLRAGDLVQTLDAGAQPILWAGARQLAARDLEVRPDLRPVLIRDGALGNRGDLLVSPQHALLVATDQGPHLVRARHLAQLGDGRFRLARGRREVCYHHLLLPQHAVIFANGAACESLYPGPQALRAFGRAVCAELLAVIPQLQPVIAGSKPTSAVYGPLVRPLLARNAVQRLDRVQAGRQMA